MRQFLLKNATKVYYKMGQLLYYKMCQFHYKMKQLLQNVTILLENVKVITKCNVYYKFRQYNFLERLSHDEMMVDIYQIRLYCYLLQKRKFNFFSIYFFFVSCRPFLMKITKPWLYKYVTCMLIYI